MKKYMNQYPVADSNFIGEIGKRDEFFIKILHVQYVGRIEASVYTVIDRDGNYGVFFSKNDISLFNFSINDCVLIKMTVKKHEVNTFHGGKETTFNRLRVIQNYGQLPASSLTTVVPTPDVTNIVLV